MPDELSFGERIRELRKALSLTQRELAERVQGRLHAEERRGFDVTYLSKIENARLPAPSAAAIAALAAELGADPDDLLALAGKVPPDLGKLLRESEGARAFFRSALRQGMSEQDWQALLQALRRRRGRE